jgi:putative nucleotidyltransferase with HDIG domain
VRCAKDPHTGLSDLVEFLAKEPTLCLSILRVTNSPLWLGARKVQSIKEACIRLGMINVLQIAKQELLRECYQLGDTQLDELSQAMWANATATATAARFLAQSVKLDSPLLHDAALFHNIGEIGLLSIVAKRQVAERGRPDFRNRVIDAYVEHHATLGARILEDFGVAREVVDVARLHHDIVALRRAGVDEKLGLVVQLAWEMALEQGFGYPCRDHRFDVTAICDQLGITVANARLTAVKAFSLLQ